MTWYKRSIWFCTSRYQNISSTLTLTETLWFGSTLCLTLDPCIMSHVFQDILNGSTSNKPFFTSVATITVHVKDIDNRPPWYQPCVRANLGTAKLCVSTGYKGRVNLTEKEVSTCCCSLVILLSVATLLVKARGGNLDKPALVSEIWNVFNREKILPSLQTSLQSQPHPPKTITI